MSTLRTSNLIHGSSAVNNIVLDTIGRAIFGPNGPNGKAALYVNPQTNRVGVNTESPTATLTVDGTISATGDVTVGGTINVAGTVSVAKINAGAGTESAPSVSIGTTDNGFYAPATDEIGISTNGNEGLRIDSSGRLLAGMSTSQGSGSVLQVREDSLGTNIEIFRSFDTPTTPPRIRFSKSRGTEASPLAVGTGDSLGEIRWNAYDGNDYNSRAALIAGFTDGAIDINETPGKLIFSTTPLASESPQERMRINSAGQVIFKPGADIGNALQVNGADTTSELLEIGIASGGGYAQLTATNAAGGSNSCGLIFRTRGSSGTAERMRIDTTGYVGIGTPSPQRLLHVFSSSIDTLGLFYSGDQDAQINFQDSTSVANGVSIGCRGDAYYVRSGLSTTRLYIDSDGDVGIGTLSPSTKLDVRGEISVEYNALHGIRFYNEDRTNWSSIGNNIGTGSTKANLTFRDSTGEVMRLNGDGSVLIKTSTAPTGLAAPSLVVNGSTTTKGGSGTCGTTFTDIPGATVGNETAVYLVTIRAIGDGNFYSSATYILNSAAYAKTYTEIGTTANHFGNGALSSQLSSYSTTSASIQVKRSGSGLASVIVQMFRLL